MRNAAPGGPPCGRADPWIARDHRPMTLAGAPLGAPPRRFPSGVGPRFRPGLFPGSSASSWQGARSGQPGGAPTPPECVVDEPHPQAPHLAPSAERHRLTPLSEQGKSVVLIFLLKSI